ncbi:MAG: chemotaxis protein CheC [Deltaproteobacteria bacterium]
MKDELDILREVGTIAAAQASGAVSEILGRQIKLNLPSLDIIAYDQLHKKTHIEKVGIAIFARILSGLQGEIALILDEKDAFKLMNLSYKIDESEKNAGIFTEVGLSLMKEIGNIAICSYTAALGMLLKRQIITSIPTLMNGSTDTIINSIFRPRSGQDYAFLIEAVFEEPQMQIHGGFCLGLTSGAASDIKETCKKLLEELEQ